MADPYADIRPEAGSNVLAALNQKAEELIKLEDDILEKEEELKQLQDRHRQITQFELPELMDAAEQSDIGTKAGHRVQMSETIRASLKKHPEEALNYLEENDAGDLIKRTFTIQFDRDDEAWAKKFASDLARRKKPLNSKVERTVHANTLTSWVKSKLEAGEDIPQETFGVFRQRFAKVKRAKEQS
jgi:hypothetical protein